VARYRVFTHLGLRRACRSSGMQSQRTSLPPDVPYQRLDRGNPLGPHSSHTLSWGPVNLCRRSCICPREHYASLMPEVKNKPRSIGQRRRALDKQTLRNEPNGDGAADTGDEEMRRENRARKPDLITISLVRVAKHAGNPREYILYQPTRPAVAQITS
jgi:hypothetical protein